MCEFSPNRLDWFSISKISGDFLQVSELKITQEQKPLQVRNDYIYRDVLVGKRHHRVNVLGLVALTLFCIVKQWVEISAHSACASAEVCALCKKVLDKLLHFSDGYKFFQATKYSGSSSSSMWIKKLHVCFWSSSGTYFRECRCWLLSLL